MTAPIDRATAEDLVTLATDVGPAPLQVGAVLRLDPSDVAPEDLVARLGERIRAVPRLRQRLTSTPPGCGRPIWVDDADFTVGRHVDVAHCPAPGDEQALLDVAADVIAVPLLRDRPLWRMVVVTGLDDGGTGLVVAFHHVLTDGIGGLAMLAALVDGWDDPPPDDDFPRPLPRPATLLVDAARSRVRVLRAAPESLRRSRAAVELLRAGDRKPLQRCSLNRTTGPRRRFTVVRADLAPVREAAHAHGATVNDVVLTAVTGALGEVLGDRGEQVDQFVVSIPVAARTETTATELGNRVGAVPVTLPATGPWQDRLRTTAVATRRAKDGWRGATQAVMGPVFRAFAATGLFRRFVERQHLVHTFVTNLRGPAEPMSILGARIRTVDAVAVIPGNVTVSFAVLSYAGSLSVTLVADPDTCPDLDAFGAALAARLQTGALGADPPAEAGPPVRTASPGR